MDASEPENDARRRARSAWSSTVHNGVSSGVAGSVIQAQVIGEVTVTTPTTAPASVPKQLPPTPHEFVNRTHELHRLTRSVEGRTSESRPVVLVLSGMSGVGKTAIGVHWAHKHRDRFEGGQLYADLSAYRHHGGVGVSDVLAAFLRALGVHEQFIPIDLPERAALFRTKTAETRVLIMLDDVGQAAEVRPLIPGSAGSVVLVTSRNRLSGLVMDGAVMVELHPLTPLDSSALVARMLPPEQVDSDPEALHELIRLCAGLPVALRVAGARLVRRRQETGPLPVRRQPAARKAFTGRRSAREQGFRPRVPGPPGIGTTGLPSPRRPPRARFRSSGGFRRRGHDHRRSRRRPGRTR